MKEQYDLIRQLEGDYPVEVLCAVLQVSRSGYYRYRKGETYQVSAGKQKQLEVVNKVFLEHKRRYGSRRIVAELQEQPLSIGRHRVRALRGA